MMLNLSYPSLNKKRLDQDNYTNPDQNKCTNRNAGDIGPPDELNGDCDTIEKDQAADTLPDFAPE